MGFPCTSPRRDSYPKNGKNNQIDSLIINVRRSQLDNFLAEFGIYSLAFFCVHFQVSYKTIFDCTDEGAID